VQAADLGLLLLRATKAGRNNRVCARWFHCRPTRASRGLKQLTAVVRVGPPIPNNTRTFTRGMALGAAMTSCLAPTCAHGSEWPRIIFLVAARSRVSPVGQPMGHGVVQQTSEAGVASFWSAAPSPAPAC